MHIHSAESCIFSVSLNGWYVDRCWYFNWDLCCFVISRCSVHRFLMIWFIRTRRLQFQWLHHQWTMQPLTTLLSYRYAAAWFYLMSTCSNMVHLS